VNEERQISHRATHVEGGEHLGRTGFFGCGRVFNLTVNAFRLAWHRAVKRGGLLDLRFHDLRHEAISRSFELGLSVAEVGTISGHSDPRVLLRYTHLQPMRLAQKLRSKAWEPESQSQRMVAT